MYVANFGMHIPNFGIYVPNFGIENSSRTNNFLPVAKIKQKPLPFTHLPLPIYHLSFTIFIKQYSAGKPTFLEVF